MNDFGKARPTSYSYFSQRLRLHYLDWGNESAPDLLLVHGVQDHCHSWDWPTGTSTNAGDSFRCWIKDCKEKTGWQVSSPSLISQTGAGFAPIDGPVYLVMDYLILIDG